VATITTAKRTTIVTYETTMVQTATVSPIEPCIIYNSSLCNVPEVPWLDRSCLLASSAQVRHIKTFVSFD
jgi:hypothetical protein